MKKLWMTVLATMVLAASPAFAVTQVPVGTTHQCWDFNLEPINGDFVYPNFETLDNPFGRPIGMINDMSGGQGVEWSREGGYIYGPEFKLILDIPNQPIANPYKELTVKMRYQGDVSFLWVADIDTLEKFTPMGKADIVDDQGWKILTQTFRFEPNPREELVVLGLKAAPGAAAALDQICIDTICIPEPATIAMLALGCAGIVMKRKRN